MKTISDFRLGDALRYRDLARKPTRERTTQDVMELWGIQETWKGDKEFWALVRDGQGQLPML